MSSSSLLPLTGNLDVFLNNPMKTPVCCSAAAEEQTAHGHYPEEEEAQPREHRNPRADPWFEG